MFYYDYPGSPKTVKEDQAFCYDFSVARNAEMLEFGPGDWEPVAGGMSYVARLRNGYGQDAEARILKVPHRNLKAQQLGRIECAMPKLISATEPPCPYETPQLLRQRENPFYFVMTAVPGYVLSEGTPLTSSEQYMFGHDMGRLSVWGTAIDVERFKAEVEQPYAGRWNWHKLFDNLEDFSNERFPSLCAVAQEMHALRQRFYPRDRDPTLDSCAIHGDARLANVTFDGKGGERRLRSVFDWGAARLGTPAEEARSLYGIGTEAIKGYNDEREAQGLLPVDLNEVRLWDIGRCVTSLVMQVRDGISDPDEYVYVSRRVSEEYSAYDWSELTGINARLIRREGLSGMPFGQSFSA